VVRSAHRTFAARVIAVCLLAFAASPVTAPFSVFEPSDFDHSRPANHSHHRPAHEMAEANVKVATHLDAMAPDVTSSFVHVRLDDALASILPLSLTHGLRARRVVLRL
jgi:hypothetical protein